jgi:hypothetical protein
MPEDSPSASPRLQNLANVAPDKRKAGDIASELRWKTGHAGIFFAYVTEQGALEIGIDGLNSAALKEVACHTAAIAVNLQKQGR